MTDLLRDSERKRCRAMHDFDVLRESIERFANIDREPVRGQFDRDASKYVFEVSLEPINPCGKLSMTCSNPRARKRLNPPLLGNALCSAL